MKVLFVYSGNSGTGQNKIVESQAKSLVSENLEIELFPIKGKGYSGYFSNIFKLSCFLRQHSFHIIHAHYGLSAMVAFFSRKHEKLIVSFMGDDLVGTNKLNGSLTLWSRLLLKINVLFARWVYNYSIVKSHEMEARLLKNTAYSLIPNGVNFEVFHKIDQSIAREQLGITNEKKIVLFVSDPNRVEKNYTLSEKAVKIINNNNVVLVAVSNRHAEELNLYYNGADLLLITSFHEGSPNVVKEAMACGCPVVSTDVGDVRWLFGDLPGHYITSFDPIDVAQGIDRAITFREKQRTTEGKMRLVQLGLGSEEISVRIRGIYNRILS